MVRLRPLKIEDIEKINLWRNNIDLTLLTQGIRYPKTLEMDREWYNNVVLDKSNKSVYFGIDEIASNEFIGIAQLTNIDYISRTAIWGMVIGEEGSRGKGLGFESLNLLLYYGFSKLNLRKISAYHIDFNIGVVKMHTKIEGVFKEATLQRQIFIDNKYHDVHIYSVFRDDYKEHLARISK